MKYSVASTNLGLYASVLCVLHYIMRWSGTTYHSSLNESVRVLSEGWQVIPKLIHLAFPPFSLSRFILFVLPLASITLLSLLVLQWSHPHPIPYPPPHTHTHTSVSQVLHTPIMTAGAVLTSSPIFSSSPLHSSSKTPQTLLTQLLLIRLSLSISLTLLFYGCWPFARTLTI